MKGKAFFVLLLAFVLGAAGCSRSENPLDWEIKATRPASLQRWLNKNGPLMPPELFQEFDASCAHIASKLPKLDQSRENERLVRLCLEIDGLTVRAVIIKGLRIESENMAARIDNQSNTLLRLINVDAGSDKTQQARQAAMISSYQRTLERLKNQHADMEKRLAELMLPPPPNGS